jgi:transposase
MGRPRKIRPDWNAMATIWTVSDELWDVIQPILAELDPPKATGRRRVDARRTLDAILFRLRRGCQWNHLPARFPDDSSLHRTFQRWVRAGVFARLGAVLIARCEELGGVEWEWEWEWEWQWQAADTMLHHATPCYTMLHHATPCWARRAWGGPDRASSHRPRQARGETPLAGRGGWWAAGPGDRGGHCP